MINIRQEVVETINDIYDDLSAEKHKLLVAKSLAKLASKQLEDDDSARNIRVISAIMDAYDESEELVELESPIEINSSWDNITWDDIKHAFSDRFMEKYSETDEREEVEETSWSQNDKRHNIKKPREGDPSDYFNDYLDYEKGDEYDEDARSYSALSLKKKDARQEAGDGILIGKDKRNSLRPGNMLDEAVAVPRTKADFSISR